MGLFESKKSKFNKKIQDFRQFIFNEGSKWYREIDALEEMSFPVSFGIFNNDHFCIAESEIFEDGDILILLSEKKGNQEIKVSANFIISSNWTIVTKSIYDENFNLVGDIELIKLDVENQDQVFIDYINKFLELYRKYEL